MVESSEHRKTPEYASPQAVAIDFDKTLGNVTASMERFYTATRRCGVNEEQIKKINQARLTKENDGGSFEPLSLLQEMLTEESMEQFTNHFRSLDGPPILYDDAMPFLKRLGDNAIPHYVLTYGVSPKWQQLKIDASGYRGEVKIIEHTDKGLEIATSPYRAESICLIDDKAAAFQSLPEHCIGFLLQRSNILLQNQQGELPPNVKIIRSLNELEVVNGIIIRQPQ